MINHDAIRLLDWYFRQPDPFANDADAFFNNVTVFRSLKQHLLNGPVSGNGAFRRRFSSFYVMRFVPADAKNVFFAQMDELRERHINLDAKRLTEELQIGMGRYYFSFTTKMLNLLDDKVYPIYDSQVGVVFQRPITPDESRLDHQAAVYQDILDTYRELENHPVIEAFRTRFNCPDLGYMKILDALFWRLGKLLDENGLELTPAEFLQEHEG